MSEKSETSIKSDPIPRWRRALRRIDAITSSPLWGILGWVILMEGLFTRDVFHMIAGAVIVLDSGH